MLLSLFLLLPYVFQALQWQWWLNKKSKIVDFIFHEGTFIYGDTEISLQCSEAVQKLGILIANRRLKVFGSRASLWRHNNIFLLMQLHLHKNLLNCNLQRNCKAQGKLKYNNPERTNWFNQQYSTYRKKNWDYWWLSAQKQHLVWWKSVYHV